MSGYGFYEEEGEGLVTGAGARPKRRYVVEMATSTRTGRKYPRRLGYTLEYAAKKLYNKQLAANNPWLKFVSQDNEIRELRKAMGERMRQIAAEYRQGLSPEKRAVAERRAAARRESKARENTMLGNIIANFRAKFPEPEKGLEYILANKTMPNRGAVRVFLKSVYEISKEQVDKLLPKRKRAKAPRYKTAAEKEFLAEPVKVTLAEEPKLEEIKPAEAKVETKLAAPKTTMKKK